MVCFGALLGFVLVNASLIAHRWRARAPIAALAPPLLGLAITFYVLWNIDRHARLAGFAWLLLGGLLQLGLMAAGRRVRPADS